MMTPEQKAIIESWGSGIAVVAGAGSGKTFTLVQKVRALLEKNPEARFAAVSFTEKSAADLRAKLTALTLELQGKPLQGHWVTTIHGLCSSILREYPREAGFDGDETVLSEPQAQNLWQRAVESLWFDDLPPEVESALQVLSERESQEQLREVLTRVKDLQGMDVLNRLNSMELKTLSAHVLERYDRMKRRQGGVDFNDLERGADQALRVRSISQDYRKRFDLVMVDEFQDTNPVQARILDRFVKEDFSNLLVVGDPKQAIYGFRDADVSVFEEFCKKLPRHFELSVNFRSLPEILQFSNEVCEPAFVASQMSYQALSPGKSAEQQNEMRESLGGGQSIQSIEVQNPDEFAQYVKSIFTGSSETALLLRKIRGNERWLKALQNAGVPIAIESGGLLWSDPRARELAHLLKWWTNPGDEYAAVTVLRAPWVGISDPQIDEWRSLDPTFLAPFFDSDHAVARVLRGHFLTPTLTRPGEVLLSLLHAPGIESELGVFILALWHRAEELSASGLDSLKVVEELANACQDERRDRTPPPPQNSGLRIMTIHGSKGLEFDQVILLDFPERAGRQGGYPILYWDRHQGAFFAKRDEYGERVKNDPEEEPWQKLQTEKELAESKRLLYVAITRAKKRLVCVLPTTLDPVKRESIEKSRAKISDPLSRDFWRAWVEKPLQKCAEMLERKKSAPNKTEKSTFEYAPENKPEYTFKPKRPRHGVSEWNRLTQCQRRYEWSVIRPRLADEEFVVDVMETEQKFKKQKIPQSEVGTRLHRCLELGDFEALQQLEKDAGKGVFSAQAVRKWAESSPLMKEAHHIKTYKELAFEIPIKDEVLVGALDRLIVNEETGERTVVDFKVTGTSRTDEELAQIYQMQLSFYAWALETLEPTPKGAPKKTTQAVIVRIDPNGVREIKIPMVESQLEHWLFESQKIVQGAPGAPQAGASCKYCEFKSQCSEGRQYLGI